jgi:hypothetical protein
VADEGGFDLEAYPYTRAWIARVREQPRYIGLTEAVGARVSKFSDLLES